MDPKSGALPLENGRIEDEPGAALQPIYIIGVARFIDACLERVSTSAGPPVGDQASDQP